MNDKPKKITNQDIDITNKDTSAQQENLGTSMDSQGDENNSRMGSQQGDQPTKAELDKKIKNSPKTTDAD